MKPAEFEARIHELLDQRKDPRADAALVEAARCDARCLDLLERYATLLDGCASLPPVRAPLELSDRVLERLGSDANLPSAVPANTGSANTGSLTPSRLQSNGQQIASQSADGPRGRYSRAGAIFLGVAAAGLLFAATLMLDFRGQAVKVADLSHTDDAPSAGLETPIDSTDTEIPADIASAKPQRQGYVSLTEETRQSVSDLALLLPGSGRVAASGGESGQEAATESGTTAQPGWFNDVSTGIQPLTRTASGALDFFLEALPADDLDPERVPSS